MRNVSTLITLTALCCANMVLAQTQRPISELEPLVTLRIGKTADWVTVTGDAVWVGATGPDAVHEIDPRTDAEVASVALPGEPCAGLVTGFGNLWIPLCAAKPGRPALAKVELASARLVATFDVGTAAECGIAASDDSIWLMVDDAGTLVRIDPRSGSLRQTIKHLPPGSCNPRYSHGIIWVTSAKGAELTAVDAATGAVLPGKIPTGPRPRFLTDGADAIWTLNQGDGSLTRIDIASRRATASIALGTPGHGGDIAFGANVVWTTMAGTPLTAIDPTTNTVLRQWKGPGGDSLAIGHGAIWLTDYHQGTISRLRIRDALARFSPD
jgi:virginiamycin B lyase